MGDNLEITALNQLLFDCETANCGLMPRTFWVTACRKPFNLAGIWNKWPWTFSVIIPLSVHLDHLM